MVFQIAELSHVHREALVDAQFEEDDFCNLGLKTGIQHEWDFVDGRQPSHKLFDFSDREHRLVVMSQIEYFTAQGLESTGS